MNKMDVDFVRNFIKNSSPESKIYIGCDSERFKQNGKWIADYCVAVVIHIDGKHGCKVFGEVTRKIDYDAKVGRPAIRLMNEVYIVQETFEKIIDSIGSRYVEIHLDINPDKKFGSSCVVEQAIGYIKGTCNIEPMVKPNAFAASICADRLKDLIAA